MRGPRFVVTTTVNIKKPLNSFFPSNTKDLNDFCHFYKVTKPILAPSKNLAQETDHVVSSPYGLGFRCL